VLQALYFVSPIYFEAKVFRTGDLHVLVDYNPIYHMLEIIRAPLLRGEWPTTDNYIYCLGTMLTMTALAWLVGRKAEQNIIFYL
jgi:lipopolysaccharide transport system permease protein